MAAEPGTVQFSIGRVIGDSFGVLARNFVSFGILSLLIGLIGLVFGLFFLDTSHWRRPRAIRPKWKRP